MIDFLKESTFAINDVIAVAWKNLKKYYFSIAGLCLLIFIVSALSSMLGYFLNNFSKAFSIIMIILFAFTYFILQLTLLKYIFHTLDSQSGSVSLKEATPTFKEFSDTFTAGFYFLLCILFMYILVSVAALPLVYTGLAVNLVVEIALFAATVLILITWLRISFFPFFIIDRQVTPFRSIRMSLATTRGNFTKILILLGFFALSHVVYLYLNYNGYYFLAGMVTIINSFLITPLSSVALAVAYRRMTSEYSGDADPDIFHHLV